jgi:hypothetical protein
MGKGKTSAFSPSNGEFPRLQAQCIDTYNFKNWVLILDPSDKYSEKQLMENLVPIAAPLGIKIQVPVVKRIAMKNFRNLKTAMNDKDITSATFIVTVLPKNGDAAYKELKKILVAELGIPSQFITQRTLNHKAIKNISSNIVMQMVNKMGLSTWASATDRDFKGL